MNAIRDALAIALRLVSGLVPQQWYAVVQVVANAVQAADWGDDDQRWQELARIVARLLEQIEQARALEGIDLTMAARAAAEVEYTRAWRAAGMLERV